MRLRTWISVSAAICGVGLLSLQRSPNRVDAQVPVSADRAADTKAVLESSKAFSQAFQKGDAKELALHWTENGEYSDDRGVNLRGRDAIEKAFTAVLKTTHKGNVEALVESIRFPSKDTAIEEGILRRTSDGPELPSSSFYRTLHVREGGQWRIALSREWGTGQDRLEDLAWLVGAWKGTTKDKETTLSFHWDKTKPFMTGLFTTKLNGKAITTGQLKIGFDPNKNLLRSWHFDDDGGHGQAYWLRDGNRWVLDSRGALADGTPTASLNILTRMGPSEIGWRSIDRVVGGEAITDTLPLKLTRVAQ